MAASAYPAHLMYFLIGSAFFCKPSRRLISSSEKVRKSALDKVILSLHLIYPIEGAIVLKISSLR